MGNKFKAGDWVFCEFKLQQIKSAEEGRVTCVTDSMFEHSSYDMTDRCFPLDLRIKAASDSVSYKWDILQGLKPNSLNYPDLHRALVSKWIELCENIDDSKKMQALYDSLNEFVRKIQERMQELRYEEIEGISLFRK